MKVTPFAVPSFLFLAACIGVDPMDEPLGAAEQAQVGDDECSVNLRFTTLVEGAFAANVTRQRGRRPQRIVGGPLEVHRG